MGVGGSFGGGEGLGLFVTAAIVVQNIPEGLAISLGLVPRGTPVWRRRGGASSRACRSQSWPCRPSCSCSCSIRSCPSGSGWLAAGAMIWMVFAKLIPDALEDVSGPTVGVAVTLAFVALFAV